MNRTKRFLSILTLVFVVALLVMSMTSFAFADDGDAAAGGGLNKAIASAVAIGVAACGGAVAMGIATGKSSEAISRQPEAEGKIRSTFMLGLVFIETAIIYALLVVILIIFVL